jgi:hypothetical protein
MTQIQETLSSECSACLLWGFSGVDNEVGTSRGQVQLQQIPRVLDKKGRRWPVPFIPIHFFKAVNSGEFINLILEAKLPCGSLTHCEEVLKSL